MARLLVALLLVATAYATDYVLSGASGGLQTLTRDGTTEWSGVRTPNVQANRYTAGSGDVYAWFREPVPTPLATLQPSTLQYLGGIDLALNSTDNVTGSGVVQWGPSMYRVLPRGFIPYGLYVSEDVADTSLNFYCNQTLPASRERFRCINAAETIVADYSFGPTGLRMVLTPNTVPSAQVNRFVALMFTRLMVLDEMNAMTNSLATSGKDRLENSRVTVAVMWTFINLTIFFICGLLASWCAWFFPLFNGCTRKFAVPIYWLLWAVITAIISWAGGLGGYILIVVLMVFFIIVSHIVYCCVRQKRNSGPVSAEAGGDAFAVETNARPPDDSLPKGFSRCRDALGRRQMIMMGIFAIGMLISLVIMGIIFYAWTVPEYMLWDRLKNTEIGEFIPQNIQKGLATVYAFEGLATNLKMDNIFFEVTTSFCDTHYTQPLAPGDRQKAIYQEFIQKYNIDMTEYIIEDYNAFPTVNDWFIRQIKPSKRPIASADDDSVIVSPADARITVFPTFPSTEIWLKTDKFDVHTLVGASNGAQYEGGSLTIVRLAPQDYHRFHMPAAGVMAADYIIEGSYHSVGVDGMRSDNFAIYNQRRVMIFTADDARIGTFAYVAIGATCVGSIAVNGTTTAGNVINRHYAKGEELGYFQFGGSTVVLVFKAGVLEWSDDLLSHSDVAVEALVQMGNAIATVRK